MMSSRRLPLRLPLISVLPGPQKGMASVLTMLLMGMSLTATVLGTAYYIHGRQTQAITTHAQTQAQLNAWTGARMLQAYLDDLHASGKLADFMDFVQAALPSKTVVLQFAVQDVEGLIEAHITQLQRNADTPSSSVVVKIIGTTAQTTRAQASAILEVVYEVDEAETVSECSVGQPLASVVMKTNLSISGGTSGIESPAGLADLVIDGDLTIKGASQAGISACAKGDIYISGGGVSPGAQLYSQHGTVTLESVSPPHNADIWGNHVILQKLGKGSYQRIRAGSYRVNVMDSSHQILGQAFMGSATPMQDGQRLVPLPKGPGETLMERLLPITRDAQTQWLLDLSQLEINAATGAVSNVRAAATVLEANAEPLPDVLYFQVDGTEGGTIHIDTQISNSTQVWGKQITLKHGETPIIPSGLPGRPYCDTDMPDVNVEPYKAQANYVFEYIEGKAYLTIRSVKDKTTNQSLDGMYALDSSRPAFIDDLMLCNWGNNKGCLPTASDAAAERWEFNGMARFPVGTVWFDGDVSFTPSYPDMVNTILATGEVTLGNGTGNHNKRLQAPSHNVQALCEDARYIPTDLCQSFSNHGPIGLRNMAIMTEHHLHTNGWTVYGNVQIGGGLSNSANATTIYGTLSVALKDASKEATFSHGGFQVKTTTLTDTQLLQPGGRCEKDSGNTPEGTQGAARIQWSRYQ